ncbi:MAG: hypothetical protein D084_Lepto4C00289G0003 [Leptospirillum sp. Group IV 'UBA BS']|nr:MAG: hypothetical protein D084_Lepto4C00289G0003 [Leptospirillum sp. Group IV 'UBA BS']
MVPEILGSGGIGREEALSLPVERGRKEAEKRTALPGGQKGKGTRDQEDLPAPPAGPVPLTATAAIQNLKFDFTAITYVYA